MNKKKNTQGQAVIELIFSLTLLMLFVAIVLTLAREQIVRMRIHQAARYGAFMMSTGRFSSFSPVEQEIKKILKEGSPQLDIGKVTIKHKVIRIGWGIAKTTKADEVTVTYRKLKVFDIKNFSLLVMGGVKAVERNVPSEKVVCGRKELF